MNTFSNILLVSLG